MKVIVNVTLDKWIVDRIKFLMNDKKEFNRSNFVQELIRTSPTFREATVREGKNGF